MIDFLILIFSRKNGPAWTVYREHTQAIRDLADALHEQNEAMRARYSVPAR